LVLKLLASSRWQPPIGHLPRNQKP
jgi:hypothetical protein